MTTRQTLTLNDTVYETAHTRKYTLRKAYTPRDPGRITAFIPGLVLEVLVKPGDLVRRGQSLLVLEAMKMQNHVAAPSDGTVLDVTAAPGATVAKGQLLVTLRTASDTL
ncbi:acetyl-CoA carboxylase biotin carboxyl carrier protein subunit [Geothrix sp. SG200]|uniref:acetyl-CoA carboxylase biotin carboxyl carrier protein subunit n=1 Tax=Geothrix sp. SG200 TaxID=2922865 RepID=UPI001FAE3108|nr:acetyl-CoA carboxylase biotin carboxyl carrier protein subunit [Geothrix sp. SG200]